MRHRAIALVVCLLAAATPAFAQLQGGILGGPSRANLTADTDEPFGGFDPRTGMSAGVFLVAPFHPNVALEPEFLFTIKGGKLTDGDAESNFRLMAFEIPVLLHLAPASAGATRFHALVGPSFTFRGSARQFITAPGLDENVDVADATKAAELSLIAGAGVDIQRFRIDGRFAWGLTRLNQEETADDVAGDPPVKSRTFTVLVGVRLW